MSAVSAAMIVALTIWGEARGEGADGMQAVASVIVNRAAMQRAPVGRTALTWGDICIMVCKKPKQFSCWRDGALVGSFPPEDSPEWKYCRQLADQVVSNVFRPITLATLYHTTAIRPGWSHGLRPVAQIGRHVFYAGRIRVR